MKTFRIVSRASGPLAFFRNADIAVCRILLPLLCCIAWGCGGDEEAVVTSSGESPNQPVVNVSNAGPGIAAADVAPAVALASAQKVKVVKGYGSISGQILFDGDVPKPELVVAMGDPNVKDSAVCAAQDAYENELLVDEKTKGVANAFVYIYHRNAKGMKIHPDAVKLNNHGAKTIVFDQKNCRFIPHVMVVLAGRTGQTVVIKSADNIPHNTHTATIFNDEFNSIIAANDRVGVKLQLTAPESLPMPVKCDIHPWMKAHWLIINHPYATVTDKQGRFTIKNLPVGEIEFRIWHERPGYIDRNYVVNVEEGTTELDPVNVPAAMFAKQ